MKKLLKFRKIIFLSIIFLAIGVGSFFLLRSIRETSEADKINILVTILPQKEFVEVIGGSVVNVTELIHPGENHETYSPTPQDLMAIENADVYFRIGYLSFEKANVDKFKETNSDLKIVELPSDITLRYFGEGEEHDHANDFAVACNEKGGSWSEEFKECDYFNEENCNSIGGKYKGRLNPCRRSENPEECQAEALVETCAFIDSSVVVDYKSKCEEFGGSWVDGYSECESQSSDILTEEECNEINGEFDSCASECRNNPSATACIEVCVSVCKVTAEIHDENEIDPHIWLSIENTKKLVESVYQTLSEMSPENESFFRKNRDAYLASLTYAKATIEKDFENLESPKLLVFHPAWGYFADEFGLTQIAIEQDGKEPTAEQLQSIVDLIKTENVKAIFVQAQFSTQTAEAIAKDTGAVIVTIDPLAKNYIENMRSIGSTIAKNLKTTEE